MLLYVNTCTQENCEREVYATGICRKHYDDARRRRKGVNPMPVKGATSCTTDGCGREMYAKGLCTRHYDEARRREQGIQPAPPKGSCSEEGCETLVHSKGLCQNHYRQAARRERGLRNPGPKPSPTARGSRWNPNSTKSKTEMHVELEREKRYLYSETPVCRSCGRPVEGDNARYRTEAGREHQKTCRACFNSSVARAARYRKRLQENAPRDPRIALDFLIDIHGPECFWCGHVTVTGSRGREGRSIEHIVPVSKGGDETLGNCVIACKSCNSRKHDKDLDLWLEMCASLGFDVDAIRERLGNLHAAIQGL